MSEPETITVRWEYIHPSRVGWEETQGERRYVSPGSDETLVFAGTFVERYIKGEGNIDIWGLARREGEASYFRAVVQRRPCVDQIVGIKVIEPATMVDIPTAYWQKGGCLWGSVLLAVREDVNPLQRKSRIIGGLPFLARLQRFENAEGFIAQLREAAPEAVESVLRRLVLLKDRELNPVVAVAGASAQFPHEVVQPCSQVMNEIANNGTNTRRGLVSDLKPVEVVTALRITLLPVEIRIQPLELGNCSLEVGAVFPRPLKTNPGEVWL